MQQAISIHKTLETSYTSREWLTVKNFVTSQARLAKKFTYPSGKEIRALNHRAFYLLGKDLNCYIQNIDGNTKESELKTFSDFSTLY